MGKKPRRNPKKERGKKASLEKDPLGKAPLLAQMARQADGGYLGFHMPGHQGGKGLWSPFQSLMDQQGLALDLTELPGLDNLGAAKGCIAQSEALMAKLAGAATTFYLINGATGGLQAGLLAANQPGGRVLLPAHSHMSLFNGLVLSGGTPVLLPVRLDPDWGLALGVPAQLFAEAKSPGGGQRLPTCQVMVTVNPSYYGVIAALPAMAAWRDRQPEGTVWLVDEAHGAHLPYVDAGKDSALAYGADLVVQSTHKMTGTLTQTALLHCGKPRWRQPVQRALNILQSSSPSYLLLGALDSFQAALRETGKAQLQRAQTLARSLADKIRNLGAYRLWQDELPAGWQCDPCKLTLSSSPLGLSGFELSRQLRQIYKIDVELCAQSHVLLLITPGHQEADLERLVQALRLIRDKSLAKPGQGLPALLKPQRERLQLFHRDSLELIQPQLTPRQVFYSPRQIIPLKAAVGRIAATAVVPYPPGIPLVYPGMEIEQAHIEKIQAWLEVGQSCVGITKGEGQIYLGVCCE